MAKNRDEEALLKTLQRLNEPSKAAVAGGILKQLDSMPRTAPSKPVSDGSELGGKILSKALETTILKPIQTVDTGRRAAISGVRELVDILDTDPKTRASFDDWMRQTQNVNYGFGTAFPMSGWKGRIVGFIGDVALDPLTYATLGGAVPAKAVLKGGTAAFKAGTKTRLAIGKYTTGREGRQKLASFVKDRLNIMVQQGDRNVANWGAKEINTLAGEIASQGKQALYKHPFLLEDLGIRGPGIYYFGSRVKVPGSGPLGTLIEKGLTKARLGVVGTQVGGALMRAFTPKGVGRIEQFGPNAIRDFRIALSKGDLPPQEVGKVLNLLEADDLKRINISVYGDEASDAIGGAVDEARKTTVPMHKLLDKVNDPSLVPGATPDDIRIATGIRAILNDFIERVKTRATQVGAREPGEIVDGYFPRMETEAAMQHRLKIGDEAFDQKVYGVDMSRTQSVFKERELGQGKTWFGHTLTGDETVEQLNFLARNSVDPNTQSVTFDIFETDIANVMAKYVRSYAEQMATYDMVEDLTRRGLIEWMDKVLQIDPQYAQRTLVDAPQQQLQAMTAALRNWVAQTNNGNTQLWTALDSMLGDRQATLAALKAGNFGEDDLLQLKAALADAVASADAANENYISLFRELDVIIEDVDGMSNYGMIKRTRERLQQQFEALKQRMTMMDEMTSSEIGQFMQDFDAYAKRLQRFERAVENLSEAQEILPRVAATNSVDGVDLYEAVNRIAKLRGTPAPVVTANPSWTPAMKQAVGRFNDDTAGEVMLRALNGDITSGEIDDVMRYVQGRIIANEEAFGLMPNQTAFLTDLNNNVQTRGGRKTQYGKWAEAKRLIESGETVRGVYMMQDLLHQQASFAQYLEWRAILEPYGIEVGDDIVDEILRRKAQPMLHDAIARGDQSRVAQLTDADNIYGRYGGTDSFDHPFGNYRKVSDDSIVFDEQIAEYETWARLNRQDRPNQLRVQENQIQKELKDFTPEQVREYSRYRATLKRVQKMRKADIERTRVEVRQLRTQIELIEKPYQSLRDRIASFFPSAELFTDEQVLAFETTIRNILETSTGGKEILTSWLDSGRPYLEAMNELVWDMPTRREFVYKLIDLLEEHVDIAYQKQIAGLELEMVQAQNQFLRLRNDLTLIESNLGVTPKTFFQSERGQAATQDILMTGVERPVTAAKGAAKGRLTKQQALEVHEELLNSDAYPVAKSQQRAGNVAHSLAELTYDERRTIGTRFTQEEWDDIVNGRGIKLGTTRKIEAIIKTAHNRFKTVHRAEWDALNGQVADETVVQRLVQDLIAENPANAADPALVAARRKEIAKQWADTDGYRVLSKVNEARAEWVAADQAEKSKNGQFLSDRAAQTGERLERNLQDLTLEFDEWTPQSTKELDRLYKQATVARRRGDLLSGEVPEEKVDEYERVYTALISKSKFGQQRIDAVLGTPLERKTPEQLADEIRILRKLREDGIETPLIKERGSRALERERRQLLQGRIDVDNLTPEQAKEFVKIRNIGRKARSSAAQNVADTQALKGALEASDINIRPAGRIEGMTNYAETVESPVFTPSGGLVSEVIEDQQSVLGKIDEPWVAIENLRNAKTTKVVPVKQAAKNTEVNEQQLVNLQNELEELLAPTRTSLVDASRGEAAAAARRVQQAQAVYDQAENLAAYTPESVKQIEEDIRLVSGLLTNFEQKVAPTVKSKADRVRVTKEAATRRGQLYETLDEARIRMEEALAVVKQIGDKDQIDAVDAVILAQIDAEAQFFQSVANMSQAAFDRQMLQSVQASMSQGAVLLPNGKLRLPNGSIVDGVPVDAVAESNKRLLKQGFATLNEKYYPELQATEEFAALWNNASRAADPEWIRKLALYIGPYTKAWKAFAVLSPGFHVRNGIGNAVTFTVAGGNIDNLIRITPIYASWAKAKKAGVKWEVWLRSQPPELVPQLEVARLGALGSGGGIFTETFKEATGGSKIYDNWLTRKNYAIGQAADNYIRFALAFDTAVKGGDVGLAQARVKRFFFDYEDLSNLDKVMRQIIPFWLWTTRNMTMQIQNMWLNPRPYLIYESLKRNFRDKERPDPPFVRELGGFKLPFGEGLFLMPDVGFNRLENDIKMFYDPKAFLNKANPLIKIPAEQIMGETTFTEKPLTTTEERVLAALRATAPPVGQAERLFANEGLSQLNAWLGYLGSPVRKYN